MQTDHSAILLGVLLESERLDQSTFLLKKTIRNVNNWIVFLSLNNRRIINHRKVPL